MLKYYGNYIKKGCKNFQHINLDGNESRCESNKNYLKLIKPKNNNRAEIHGIKNITFNKKKYIILVGIL